jgi:hypothetical protein
MVKVVTAKSEEQLKPMLAELQLGEFIYEQPQTEITPGEQAFYYSSDMTDDYNL